jgi:hypothetical protein
MTSAFANLVAGLANVPVDDLPKTNIDRDDFIGRRVDVLLKPDRDGFVCMASIAPLGSAVVADAST